MVTGKLQSEHLLRMDNISVEGDEFMPVSQVPQQQQPVAPPIQNQMSPQPLLGTPAGQVRFFFSFFR